MQSNTTSVHSNVLQHTCGNKTRCLQVILGLGDDLMSLVSVAAPLLYLLRDC